MNLAYQEKKLPFLKERKVKLALETLGCKANVYDSESIAARCEQLGFEIVPFEKGADVYVVNTCTVTHAADRSARNLLRKAHRLNKEALVIATGCSGEMYPEQLRAIDGVDAVFGTSDRHQLIEYLFKSFSPLEETPPSTLDDLVPYHQQRARAYLKIQDGCDRRCTYCIIWRARGKSVSKTIPELIQHTNALVEAGYNEIVLTGIHIGSYGNDFDEKCKLSDLVKALLKHTDIKRIRLTSLDPEGVDDDIKHLLENEKRVCRYLHLSLQSASNTVIKRMMRKTDSHQARKLVQSLDKHIPDMAISADIIAGFPGETEEEFLETKTFLEEAPLSWIHVFPFSAREGTAAARRVDKLDPQVVKQRARELSAIAHQKREAFYASLQGKICEAIVIDKRQGESGFTTAISDNDVPLLLAEKHLAHRSLCTVKVEKVEGLKVYGTCLE
ncbi:MAG: tRNA (N(6)-L-threonylcarbamoyladenosine(37)-C(2))-methylthiotransferase MtaB [Deltaproteobacteria bacterium CG_4_10_14_0_2_um_filter_43_8]|nr:MAG: tRNA (N(6)-L-threonylcarbamoyladenosine(37)-C(2))-methylthiotransferase MtaB [Deltaproteobacteria bacterium CG11_big_fil_rev_8_21_14_0_20_42_23]PJA18944.1 MAG: tRNA (N(6)-L-threonylcarbamoyladenosine(37)-C(2))-methylthiotransferase MtaB [Deltaproteobacteria bacterium CG_4_10_14_0_2_um_filter_43_8]PJC64672.1 MAG: tRNA (N(6)-L-threonylcarbamoyladenosine(37)-C(2))-methylthiotransferase MtaB [Deltaproteobacteria bacterium CG_4_9_14_0_2_um_filter_42_21]